MVLRMVHADLWSIVLLIGVSLIVTNDVVEACFPVFNPVAVQAPSVQQLIEQQLTVATEPTTTTTSTRGPGCPYTFFTSLPPPRYVVPPTTNGCPGPYRSRNCFLPLGHVSQYNEINSRAVLDCRAFNTGAFTIYDPISGVVTSKTLGQGDDLVLFCDQNQVLTVTLTTPRDLVQSVTTTSAGANVVFDCVPNIPIVTTFTG